MREARISRACLLFSPARAFDMPHSYTGTGLPRIQDFRFMVEVGHNAQLRFPQCKQTSAEFVSEHEENKSKDTVSANEIVRPKKARSYGGGGVMGIQRSEADA